MSTDQPAHWLAALLRAARLPVVLVVRAVRYPLRRRRSTTPPPPPPAFLDTAQGQLLLCAAACGVLSLLLMLFVWWRSSRRRARTDGTPLVNVEASTVVKGRAAVLTHADSEVQAAPNADSPDD
jgi:hypothetical protein